MTTHDIDLPTVLAERLTTTTHPDVLCELLATFIDTLMRAEADALCGAGYAERTNSRNGYRHRNSIPAQAQWTWRSPSCGTAAYFPDWLTFLRSLTARGFAGLSWSPATRTPEWSPRWAPCCQELPGSVAARTTRRT